MVSMFFCFISAMPELAVSRVNLAKACTYASLSSCCSDKKTGRRVKKLHGKRYSKTLIPQFRLQYLYGEDACYPDGTTDPLQTQRGHLSVITVLKTHAESCQEGCPCQLRNNRGMRCIICVRNHVCVSKSAHVCVCLLVLP